MEVVVLARVEVLRSGGINGVDGVDVTNAVNAFGAAGGKGGDINATGPEAQSAPGGGGRRRYGWSCHYANN